MKVKANFLARFWDLFGVEEKEVELESGASVRDLVERLCHTKECYQAIFDESGRPRGDVKILRKGERRFWRKERLSSKEGKDIGLMKIMMFLSSGHWYIRYCFLFRDQASGP